MRISTLRDALAALASMAARRRLAAAALAVVLAAGIGFGTWS